MGMGKRPESRQQEFWVTTESLAEAPRHVFYDRLNSLLREAGFDPFVEALCEPHYQQGGRPSIPPGLYFRMLFVGYFEDISSQRGIAWRCADSLSLRKFLGIAISDSTPDHSSLTKIRQRLPTAVSEQVFEFVLKIAAEKKLLNGKTVGVDSTTLEANAAMRSIVRKDNGDDWKEYLRKLAEAEGVQIENDEDLRRFDQQRKKEGKKKVSNKDWESPDDPDARIMKMKDGRTHLGYKAEHVTDLDTEIIIQASVCHGTDTDPQTIVSSLVSAQMNLDNCLDGATTAEPGTGVIEEVAADKGYHANEVLKACADLEIRTYIPEREGDDRRWDDKDEGMKEAFHGNRQRMKRSKGKMLQKRRSELVERGFAHICETGGSRRTWLRGLDNIRKRYLVAVAGHNLAIIMRSLFGFGKPRAFSAAHGLTHAVYLTILAMLRPLKRIWRPSQHQHHALAPNSNLKSLLILNS